MKSFKIFFAMALIASTAKAGFVDKRTDCYEFYMATVENLGVYLGENRPVDYVNPYHLELGYFIKRTGDFVSVPRNIENCQIKYYEVRKEIYCGNRLIGTWTKSPQSFWNAKWNLDPSVNLELVGSCDPAKRSPARFILR